MKVRRYQECDVFVEKQHGLPYLMLGEIVLDDGLFLYVISEAPFAFRHEYTHLLEPATGLTFFWSILQHVKSGAFWVSFDSSEEHSAIRMLYCWIRLSEFMRLVPAGHAAVFEEQPRLEMNTHDKMVPYFSTMHDDIVVTQHIKDVLRQEMKKKNYQPVYHAQEERIKSFQEWVMWDQI